MKTWTLLLPALIACAAAATAIDRSVTRVSPERPAAGPRFEREQSTALFVGVRRFEQDPHVPEVWFAVDDAIDLAYAFALERNIRLVPPQRVVLALAGPPVKPESSERLEKLESAGARLIPATNEAILQAVREQAERAGAEGLFVAGFASHGFTAEGTAYVLSATSRFHDRATSLSAAKVFELASAAQRSLIFIDACRERVGAGARGTPIPPADTAPLTRQMSTIQGQVVFYAGTFAYDDFKARNGVFTLAVLEGLRCSVADARGIVTIGRLAAYVEKRVRKWIQENRDPRVRVATTIQTDGDSAKMPLASCVPRRPVLRAEISGSAVVARAADETELWRREIGGRLIHAAVADLDADKSNDVVVGSEEGEVVAFAADGERMWSATLRGPNGEPAMLRTFITADLFRKKTRQVIALTSGREPSTQSRLTIIAPDGVVVATHAHQGAMEQVVVDRLTARHAPKIIVGAGDGVFMLEPKNASGRALWYGVLLPAQTIEHLETIDHDNDGKRDIALRTSKGKVFLTFDGRVLNPQGAHVSLMAR